MGIGAGFGLPYWDFLGTTMVTSSHVRLTADKRSQTGAIWNNQVFFSHAGTSGLYYHKWLFILDIFSFNFNMTFSVNTFFSLYGQEIGKCKFTFVYKELRKIYLATDLQYGKHYVSCLLLTKKQWNFYYSFIAWFDLTISLFAYTI